MKEVNYTNFRYLKKDNQLIITDNNQFINERVTLETIYLDSIAETNNFSVTTKQRDNYQFIVILTLFGFFLLLGAFSKVSGIFLTTELIELQNWAGLLYTAALFFPLALILIIFFSEFILDFGNISHFLYQKFAKGKTEYNLIITTDKKRIKLTSFNLQENNELLKLIETNTSQ